MSKPCNLVAHPRAAFPLALSVLCGCGTGGGRAQPQVWVLCGHVRDGIRWLWARSLKLHQGRWYSGLYVLIGPVTELQNNLNRNLCPCFMSVTSSSFQL